MRKVRLWNLPLKASANLPPCMELALINSKQTSSWQINLLVLLNQLFFLTLRTAASYWQVLNAWVEFGPQFLLIRSIFGVIYQLWNWKHMRTWLLSATGKKSKSEFLTHMCTYIYTITEEFESIFFVYWALWPNSRVFLIWLIDATFKERKKEEEEHTSSPTEISLIFHEPLFHLIKLNSNRIIYVSWTCT